MASLGEMMQYADYVGNVEHPEVGAFQNLAGGFLQGQSLRKSAETATLDRTLKIMDIHEKMAKVKESQQNMEIASNMAKASGLIPLDDHESSIFQKIYFDSLNPDAGTPKVNTELGKMQSGKLHEMYDWGFSQKGGYSFKSKKGNEITPFQAESLKLQKERNGIMKDRAAAARGAAGKKDAADSLIRNQRIDNMAIKAAQVEFADKLRAQGIDDIQQGAMGLSRVMPPKHLVDKYRAQFSKSLGTDKEKALATDIKGSGGLLDEGDLNDLLGDGNF